MGEDNEPDIHGTLATNIWPYLVELAKLDIAHFHSLPWHCTSYWRIATPMGALPSTSHRNVASFGPVTPQLLSLYCLQSSIITVALQQAEMRMVRCTFGVKLKDRLPSKELREGHNLGTTAKQAAIVWACVAK